MARVLCSRSVAATTAAAVVVVVVGDGKQNNNSTVLKVNYNNCSSTVSGSE